MWVCALAVLVPLTAANAQEPAPAEASAEGAAAASVEASATTEASAKAEAVPPPNPGSATPTPGTAAALEVDDATKAEARRVDAESDEPEERERSEPNLSMSAQLGAGYLSGGHGGLFDANRSPLALDVQVMTVREPRYLLGGALRIELEGAHAVAAIARLQLRHPLGPIELRPGIGLPFYFAPRTMLGAEAGMWGRLTFSQDLALLLALSASAFVMGDDVPKGNTVIMLQIFVGVELFI